MEGGAQREKGVIAVMVEEERACRLLVCWKMVAYIPVERALS